MSAAHFCTQIARVLFGVVCHGKNIGLKNRDRNVQQCRIAFDFLAVQLIVARVHHKVHKLKRHFAVFLQLLQKLCHQHGILAAGDAHRNLVVFLNELVTLYRSDERHPDRLAEFLLYTALNALVGFKFSFHFM